MNKKKDILQNHLFLYLTEFFSGMSVMAVELGASRLLAPYFSSSQIVWTIIIGTIMIAMALGNVMGGRWADRNPDPDKLYRRILIASIWIAAIPFLGRYLIIGISGLVIVAVNQWYLIWAALAACLVIFVYPLFLLGTVTPSLAKYTVQSLEDSGKIIGSLGACNTIGSIIGTFVPTFVTIPTVGTAATFLIFAGILLVLCLVYFISRHSSLKHCAVSTVLFILCAVLGFNASFAFWEDDLAYEGESIYNYLQVRDEPDRTVLSTNVLFGVQSVYMKSTSLTGMYYDYAMAAPLMADAEDPAEESMLILGMGTGTYAKQCQRYMNIQDITGVEIDQKITDLSETYFEADPDIPVVTYDGRAYLNASEDTYDVIMVDAYQDITIPFQMSSAEFFELVRSHLKPGGVMVVNMNMRNAGDNGINQYLSDTIASVFAHVETADVQNNTNRILFASETDMESNLSDHLDDISSADLKSLMQDLAQNLTVYEGGEHIMTDDKAPVELLGMRAIDGIIGDEVGYYKDIFQREGLSGLLESVQ
jgi:spermidine synthase